MIFLFILRANSLPSSLPPPIEYSPTPAPTTPQPTTPIPTEERREDFYMQTVVVEAPFLYGDIFITFIALICVAVLGIIIAVTVYCVKKNKSAKVSATMEDEEEEDDEVLMTRGFEPSMSRASKSSKTSKTSKTANTTIVAKSIYAVDTSIL